MLKIIITKHFRSFEKQRFAHYDIFNVKRIVVYWYFAHFGVIKLQKRMKPYSFKYKIETFKKN